MQAVDKAIHNIMHNLRVYGEREVSTLLLGEWAMAELKELDQVAYVRFASVYRRFEDINAFGEEVEKLKSGTS